MIKHALDNGLKCYAECGGLMYLTEGIEGKTAVRFFEGTAHMGAKLQNFGYATLKVNKESLMLRQGLQINCHEFHKSYVDLKEETIYNTKKEVYDGTTKKWKCGYLKGNTLATYAHIHFFGNIDFIKELLNIDLANERRD